MITFSRDASCAIALSLAIATVPTVSVAANIKPAATPAGERTTDPAARPTDRTMTCPDIVAERTAIVATVGAAAAKSEAAKRTKKRLFGFAKGLASFAVPGASLMMGSSALGNLAAQQAGQMALNAANASGDAAPVNVAFEPTADQQARLARLDRIAAFRQCPA